MKAITYEIKFSKSVLVISFMAAIGLLLIGLKPIIDASPAFAQSETVHKIAICNANGEACAGVRWRKNNTLDGYLQIYN